MTVEYHPGKFDSFRDSALHYLCTSDWANESFGDMDYGVYIWRISNNLSEVSTDNSEINSVLEEWAPMEGYETLHTDSTFRETLAGHFLVSENDQGMVTVHQFATEAAALARFKDMQAHYEEWSSTTEDEA
jgi:hypothetical protein